MNILFLENDKKTIKSIYLECEESHHQIFLINELANVDTFLKETKFIDILIVDLDLTKKTNLNYIKKVRKKNLNLNLIVISDKNLILSFREYEFLNILKFLKKPFDIKKLKKILSNIEKEYLDKKLSKSGLSEENYKELQIKNEELNSTLKPFKEFSFYSETDLNGVIIEISDSFSNLVGYKKTDLIGKKHSILKHPLEEKNKYIELWKKLLDGNTWIGELRCIDKYNNDIWYKTIIFPKKNEKGDIIGYAAKRQDITDKKQAEMLSITNDLTGLYNKRFFKQTFLNEKNRARRDKKDLSFYMIDVDHFKKYNDNYGHLEGDNVLRQIGNILKLKTKRSAEFAFRIGGEEFAILTSDLKKGMSLEYAEDIRKSIVNLKIKNKESEYSYITVSIGVFILKDTEELSLNSIYTSCDYALYQAKKLGRNKVILYK